MFMVNNIKVSFKLENLLIDNLISLLNTKNIDYKISSKYLIIRSTFTYSISKTKNSLISHVNISKIRNFTSIDEAVYHFCNVICNDIKPKNISIDNITATFKYEKIIDLKTILKKKSHPLKYNKEKFPGLFLKLDKCTLLIFHTGKVNSVGCKSEIELKDSFSDLIKILNG